MTDIGSVASALARAAMAPVRATDKAADEQADRVAGDLKAAAPALGSPKPPPLPGLAGPSRRTSGGRVWELDQASDAWRLLGSDLELKLRNRTWWLFTGDDVFDFGRDHTAAFDNATKYAK